jgi:hypothetical protein
MAFVIQYPVVKTPQSALTYGYRAKLPIKRPCPILPPVFVLNEGDSWGCILCGADQNFKIPYRRGDVFPFQTTFADNRNDAPENLVFGFKDIPNPTNYFVQVEVLDENGAVVFSDVDLFCDDYYVAHSNDFGSVQTWFLNSAFLPVSLKCWRLRVTYYRFNQISLIQEVERVIFSEYFEEIPDCNKSFVGISSTYDSVDCNGNIYSQFSNFLGTNNPAFYNFILLEGEVEFTESSVSVESEADSGKVLRREKIDNYRINSTIVAPFFAKMLDVVVNGNNVLVDNIQYRNFSFGKNNQANRMWFIQLTFEQICFLDGRNCSI